MSPRSCCPHLCWLLAVMLLSPCGSARAAAGKTDPGGSRQIAPVRAGSQPPRGGIPPSQVQAPPDVIGPGAVLTVGNVRMKVTNWGHLGNLFPEFSSDPAGQWPDSAGAEYLSSIRLAVAAVNPVATDPRAVRLVSEGLEWRPPTPDPVDRIYETQEGALNGARFFNDDGDFDSYTGEPRIDEEFLDGRDNDLDAMIDEDFAALGQQMFSLVMRDDTPEAIKAGVDEPHVPIGLECRQSAWAYSVPGFRDFDVVDYEIINRSGHTLDSLTIGWLVDMDCGADFQDDLDLPSFPSGEFTLAVPADDPRRQWPHAPLAGISPDSALCARLRIRLNGFATADDDGDAGATPGVPAFLLIDHTFDPLGLDGPPRVGFRSFRSARVGVPYGAGGIPTDDSTRFAFMTGTDNVDPQTGFITQAPGTIPGDYVQWCSVGPFRYVPDGGSIHATIAFTVQSGDHASALDYASDYQDYRDGLMGGAAILAKYPLLRNAFNAQIAFEGGYDSRPEWPWQTNFHGRETMVRPTVQQQVIVTEDCHDAEPRVVSWPNWDWFDFDCDYCTGVWDYSSTIGLLHHTWKVPTDLIGVELEHPASPSMAAPAPNPSRAGTRLRFDLPAAARVRVAIFDVSGRLVRPLADQGFAAGRHALWWDGRDVRGRLVPGGVYLCRVTTGERSFQSKVIVAR